MFGELRCGRDAGEPVEHAAGADRGELLAVADRDQLRSGALHQLGERVEAVGVGHARLVEEDRRVPADVRSWPRSTRATSASSVSVCPASAGLSWPRRSAVEPETATPRVSVAGVLLGAGGGVDHDALAGAGGADEDRGALGAGE